MTDVRIGELLRKKKVIVCCGAGGVGKTTTAAAISIAAARAGRKVLVLTIDPSRRLAETLGVSRNPTDPVRIPKERSDAAGITTGTLDAWMLDIKLVFMYSSIFRRKFLVGFCIALFVIVGLLSEPWARIFFKAPAKDGKPAAESVAPPAKP